jgi:PAS domain-containing protein
MNDSQRLTASLDFVRTVLDAVPLPIFVVDEDMRIFDFNIAAGKTLGEPREYILRRRGGEALHCLHRNDTPEGCGRGPSCDDCIIGNTVKAAYQGQTVTRKKGRMELVAGDAAKPVDMLVTCQLFTHDGRQLALLILEDITEMTQLRSLLPMCAKCRKVRDDQAYWQSLERYASTQMNVDFSHGLCPECAAEYLREIERIARAK